MSKSPLAEGEQEKLIAQVWSERCVDAPSLMFVAHATMFTAMRAIFSHVKRFTAQHDQAACNLLMQIYSYS